MKWTLPTERERERETLTLAEVRGRTRRGQQPDREERRRHVMLLQDLHMSYINTCNRVVVQNYAILLLSVHLTFCELSTIVYSCDNQMDVTAVAARRHKPDLIVRLLCSQLPGKPDMTRAEREDNYLY